MGERLTRRKALATVATTVAAAVTGPAAGPAEGNPLTEHRTRPLQGAPPGGPADR